MIQLKKYISGVSLVFASFVFAQQTPIPNVSSVSGNIYSTMYGNQKPNLPSLETPVAEKTVLSPKEILEVNLNSMMTDPVLKNANWGFVVYDPVTKKIVTSYNEDKPLVPASTTKLLTTETALSIIGEKYAWLTQLEYSGDIDETGNLNGNLYLIGSGDPSLGTNKAGAASYTLLVNDFINAISNKGIKKINGEIYIQTAVFKGKLTSLPENIVWLEHNNYYLPVGSTKDTNPQNEKQIVKNSGNSKQKKFFYISPVTKKLVYTDEFEGSAITTKIPDAPAYLANSLRTNLVKRGIAVSGKVIPKNSDIDPESRKTITAYKSPELKDIVNYVNHKSDNPLAEALLKQVGYFENGDLTAETGRKVVNNHLRDISFDMDGLNYMDGSGLSRANMVTPISQVKFLSSLMKEKHYKTYFESLPVGGQSGTLKRSFLLNGNGQVFAKTGTLNKVKTLAGYIKTNKGKTYVFSLLINNYSGSVDMVKNRMEKILLPVLEL